MKSFFFIMGLLCAGSGQIEALRSFCPPEFSAQSAKFTTTFPSESVTPYLIMRNTTNQNVYITFYYKKDLMGTGQKTVPVPQNSKLFSTITPHKITGFALPRFFWCEKAGTGGIKSRVRLVDILKSSPIIGFSVTADLKKVPSHPQVTFPDRRKKDEAFHYEIVPFDGKNFKVLPLGI